MNFTGWNNMQSSDPHIRLVTADSRQFIPTLEDNSIHSVVTDPPYFLVGKDGKGFMGLSWDSIRGENWKQKELVHTVEQFFLLTAIDSNMVVGSTVRKRVSTKGLVDQDKHELSSIVQSVEQKSKEPQARSRASTNSVQGFVLTKAEVLDTLRELLPNLTEHTLLRSLSESVLFAIPYSLLEQKLKNTVPEFASRLAIEKLCRARTIHLTLMEEARIKNAIAVMIGNGSENRYMREMPGAVNFVENIATPMRFKRIISKNGIRRKIIRWIISSLSAIVVMPKFTMAKQIYRWHYDWAIKVLRVLTPGAHLISFTHTKNYDLVCSAIRDAGFEIRDMLLWHYGQGFSKGKNIAKAIDKKVGALREVIGTGKSGKGRTIYEGTLRTDWKQEYDITAPSTKEAKQWYDWHTLLKPTTEPAVLARKPIEKGLTEEENVLKWGTGSLNIGACRVAVNSKLDSIGKTTTRKGRVQTTVFSDSSCGYDNEQNTMAGVLPSGRFASNLVLSHHPDCVPIQQGETIVRDVSTHAPMQKMGKHGIYGNYQVPINLRHDFHQAKPEIWACVPDCPVRMMDDIAGRKRSSSSISGNEPSSKTRSKFIYDDLGSRFPFQAYQDRGGVSRFFYCAKASPNERSLGLPEGERNPHVAVKPIELLRYYIRLVTPPGGTILDPFLGSGSSAIAALLENFNLIGVEIDSNHMKTTRLRLEYWKKNPVNPLKPPVKRVFKQQPDQTNLQNYFE